MNADGNLLPKIPNDFRDEWDHQAAHDLAQQFGRSGRVSIDRFLEEHEGGKPIQHLGKQMIAHQLLPLEAAAIGDRSLAEGWYQRLFDTISCVKKKSVAVPGLSVVTFNYDRTFEYAMLTMLANSIGNRASPPGPEALMPVVHVYGQLRSSFAWNYERCAYHLKRLAPIDVAESANGIQIVSSERQADESEAVAEARSLVAAADVVVFLGFGFDETNLRILGLQPRGTASPSHGRIKFVKACVYGVGEQRRVTIHQQLSLIESGGPVNVSLGKPDWDCDMFLAEGVDLRATLSPNLREFWEG